MQRLSWFFLALALASASPHSFADGSPFAGLPPWQDSIDYSVKGLLLNRWMRASEKQDADLRAALEQVKTSQTSFARYKKQVLLDGAIATVIVASLGFLVGRASR
jgi:hypothetical protein